MKYKLDFYTSYNQFYLCDKRFKGNTGSPSFWSSTAYHERLAMEDGILGVGIGSYGHVKAQLEILPERPVENDFSKYDHVVETGLKLNSGVLQVLSCPTSEVELNIKLNSGNYRVRVYSSNLGKFDSDENEAGDTYKIEIWQQNDMDRKVLKQHHSR